MPRPLRIILDRLIYRPRLKVICSFYIFRYSTQQTLG